MARCILYSVLFLLFSCVEDFNHKKIDTTIVNPDVTGKTEITFKQLFDLHNKEIGKDSIVMGYVVSSDLEGGFYKEIFVQNTLGTTDLAMDNPRMGMRIRVGLTTTSTKYVQGRKIIINLTGLKKTTSDDLLTLGKPSSTYIKDISEFEIDHHLLKTDEVGEVIPKTVTLANLSENELNTLVKIEDLHFKQSQVGVVFAGLPTDDYDGKRVLEYCDVTRKDTITLETSNFSDFASEIIPDNQVDVTAIYDINFDNEPVLRLNHFSDLEVLGAYISCPEIVTPNIMITEVADPKAESGEKARYIEIYNPTVETVSLDGWSLVRYNKTTSNEYRYSISLNGLSVAANGFVIVANNIDDFEKYFNRSPDLVSSSLDGNGDDAYELVDSLDEVKDIYGQPNIDGTDAAWEYEDGVAVRKISSESPNNIFDESEWVIKQSLPRLSTGGSNADFTPGIR